MTMDTLPAQDLPTEPPGVAQSQQRWEWCLHLHEAAVRFPNNTFYATNYWVDPLFTTTSDPTVPTVISRVTWA